MSKKVFYKSLGLLNDIELRAWRRDFEEWLEDMELKEDEISIGFGEWVNDNINLCWEYDTQVLEKLMKDKKYKIEANLGFWYGRRQAHTYAIGFEAIEKCIGNDSFYELEIYEERGTLKVKYFHHDGVHYFTIKEVTPKGLRSPHLSKQLWGV